VSSSSQDWTLPFLIVLKPSYTYTHRQAKETRKPRM
jgi:hypothetical protein